MNEILLKYGYKKGKETYIGFTKPEKCFIWAKNFDEDGDCDDAECILENKNGSFFRWVDGGDPYYAFTDFFIDTEEKLKAFELLFDL